MSKNFGLKSIVCVGGGNAMPSAVLQGIKKYPLEITAISATLDSGGSSGRLRKKYGIISPGDLRRAFLALSEAPRSTIELFSFRYPGGENKGHNFGNILFAALYLASGSYEKTLEEFGRLLRVRHRVLPATLSDSHLFALLENGRTISGETNIDIPKHNSRPKIKKVFLNPPACIYPASEEALRKADSIVIGPGDLYSSILQILSVAGFSRAIRESRAKKIYICNLMTKKGETEGMGVADFAAETERYLGDKVDFVIYNDRKPSVARLKRFLKKHPQFLKPVSFGGGLPDNKFIGADVMSENGDIVHDPRKLARIIARLL